MFGQQSRLPTPAELSEHESCRPRLWVGDRDRDTVGEKGSLRQESGQSGSRREAGARSRGNRSAEAVRHRLGTDAGPCARVGRGRGPPGPHRGGGRSCHHDARGAMSREFLTGGQPPGGSVPVSPQVGMDGAGRRGPRPFPVQSQRVWWGDAEKAFHSNGICTWQEPLALQTPLPSSPSSQTLMGSSGLSCGAAGRRKLGVPLPESPPHLSAAGHQGNNLGKERSFLLSCHGVAAWHQGWQHRGPVPAAPRAPSVPTAVGGGLLLPQWQVPGGWLCAELWGGCLLHPRPQHHIPHVRGLGTVSASEASPPRPCGRPGQGKGTPHHAAAVGCGRRDVCACLGAPGGPSAAAVRTPPPHRLPRPCWCHRSPQRSVVPRPAGWGPM